MPTFAAPRFNPGELEIRYNSGEICLYGTPKGLRRLAELSLKLATKTDGSAEVDHCHLEDYDLLTQDSLRAVLAVFPIQMDDDKTRPFNS